MSLQRRGHFKIIQTSKRNRDITDHCLMPVSYLKKKLSSVHAFCSTYTWKVYHDHIGISSSTAPSNLIGDAKCYERIQRVSVLVSIDLFKIKTCWSKQSEKPSNNRIFIWTNILILKQWIYKDCTLKEWTLKKMHLNWSKGL